MCTEGGIHPFRYSDTCHHADVAEKGGNRNAFHNNQPKDRKRLCTQRFAYAELACAFLDGNQHDVRYAYDAAQQGKNTYHPNGGTQQAGYVLCLYVLCKAVPYPYCAFIFRIETVVGGNDFTVLFLKGFVGRFARQIFGGEDDVVEFIAFVIDGLHGGEGDKGQAALVSLVFVQSDYPVGYAACIDKPADRFRT